MDEELCSIPANAVVRVHKLLGKLVEFFHQPMHYPNDEATLKFMQDGVYDEISDAYYNITWYWLPEKVRKEIEES